MSKKKKYRYKKIPLRDENKPEEAADKKASSADEQKGGHDTAIKKEKAEKQDASAKRRKDQFSVTIIGLIIYSFILIAIVTATYLGLKSFIRRNEAKQAEIEAARSEQAAEEEAGREDEKDAEETIDAEEDEPEDKEEDDHEAREHLADASDIITGDDNDVIDYEASLFEPAARNKDHKWVDRVFSRIENPKDPASAPVNSFEFSRRTAYLNNGNRIDLEIYKDPETGKITKITGTEYCGDNVEVIDYYYYDGDITMLADSLNTVGVDADVKKQVGNTAIRRKLTKCINLPIAHLKEGDLPLKKVKSNMYNKDLVRNEKYLRGLIKNCINKEHHSNTREEINYICQELDAMYDSGIPYDIENLKPAVIQFAANSTNQSDICLKMVSKIHFSSEDCEEHSFDAPIDIQEEAPIVFFDIECFPNLFLINWKFEGEGSPVVRMINPTSEEVQMLSENKLVGFN